jgi:hypothetical protein
VGKGECFPSDAGDRRLARALQDGNPVRVSADSLSGIELQTGDRVKAALQAPLQRAGKVLGLFSLDRRTIEAPFGEHDEQIAAILADYVVMALEQPDRRKLQTATAPGCPKLVTDVQA